MFWGDTSTEKQFYSTAGTPRLDTAGDTDIVGDVRGRGLLALTPSRLS